MGLSDYERETIISMSDGDAVASVWTAQRKLITRLKNNPAAVLVGEGSHDGSVWARFTIAADLVSFRSVRVRRELSDEQRQALSEAMRERQARARQDAAETA